MTSLIQKLQTKMCSQKLCDNVLTTNQFIHIYSQVFGPIKLQIFKGYPTNISTKVSSSNSKFLSQETLKIKKNGLAL